MSKNAKVISATVEDSFGVGDMELKKKLTLNCSNPDCNAVLTSDAFLVGRNLYCRKCIEDEYVLSKEVKKRAVYLG